MKNFSILAFFGFILIQFYSCKKEISSTSTFDFSNFTVTDSSCLYISNVDSTDWTYDANWTAAETALLNFGDTISTLDSMAGYVQVSAACSNPSAGLFILGTDVQKACTMKITVVNNKLELLHYRAVKLTGGPIIHAFDFRFSGSFHKNENYRMYYGFYTSKDSLYYKGHGDFRIE